jgi:conjugative transfer pilus assembly protein TraH
MAAFKLVKKTFLSVVLSVTLLNAGGLGDFIRNNLNGSIVSTNPGYYKTQAGGYWSAGDFKLRWDMSGANINLFHAQAPSFNVGCNGIDATFGSFSYLGFQQLVNKLKKIAAAAPAMAFQMAITSLCEQCNTIMTNLEKVADALNNFNMNACQASSWLAKRLVNEISRTGGAPDASATREKAKEDPEWEWVKSLEGFSHQFGSFGEEGLQNITGHGSVLNKALKKTYSVSFMDRDEFLAIMRAILGDIYGFDIPQRDSSGANVTVIGKFQFITPAMGVEAFVDTLAKGGKLPAIVLNGIQGKNKHYLALSVINDDKGKGFNAFRHKKAIVNTFINIPAKNAFILQFKNRIKNIVDKISTHQKLSSTDLKFINSVPFPLYRYANLEATMREQMSDAVAEWLAYASIKSFSQEFFRQLMRASGSLLEDPDYTSTVNKEVLKWQQNTIKNYKELMNRLNIVLEQKSKEIKDLDNLIDRYRKLENQMIKLSPIWASVGL